ncbi:MAG: orotidine-5'-phosphate decarboxylase [Candidatus Omnitrophota bacterium]
MRKEWNKLIVALDLEDRARIREVVRKLSPQGVKFKIGSIAFTKFGPALIREFVDKGIDIFLDLKLHDIPNTMKRTAAIITQMKCWAFTVHLSSGVEALAQVKKEIAAASKKYRLRKPLILGVSVLTSQKSTKAAVMKLAERASKVGLDGVVASPKEVKLIKSRYENLRVITPGIRAYSDKLGDQKRVGTAQYAFNQGVDYIVVGRPIVEKRDCFRAAEDIL